MQYSNNGGMIQSIQLLRPHPLKGDLSGFWAMDVYANWRIIFRFDNVSRNAYDLDFTDYH